MLLATHCKHSMYRTVAQPSFVRLSFLVLVLSSLIFWARHDLNNDIINIRRASDSWSSTVSFDTWNYWRANDRQNQAINHIDWGHFGRSPHWQSKYHKFQCQDYFPSWVLDLSGEKEQRIFSQNGEDGITITIVENLKDVSKTYVEFGAEDGTETNTRFLRELHGWEGMTMDGGNENATINLHKEMIHHKSIVSIFEKYNVSKDNLGLLSEDTDFSDYYIWKSILEAGYKPRILISEINRIFFADEAMVVHEPEDDIRFWDNSNYFGVSPLALRYLWNKHGYIMIYCDIDQINCFGAHMSDLLPPSMQNEEGLKKAQDCLWKKPLAWHREIHGCDRRHEKYHPVDENGEVDKTREVRPRMDQECRHPLVKFFLREVLKRL
jgi:hypothetical protein